MNPGDAPPPPPPPPPPPQQPGWPAPPLPPGPHPHDSRPPHHAPPPPPPSAGPHVEDAPAGPPPPHPPPGPAPTLPSAAPQTSPHNRPPQLSVAPPRAFSLDAPSPHASPSRQPSLPLERHMPSSQLNPSSSSSHGHAAGSLHRPSGSITSPSSRPPSWAPPAAHSKPSKPPPPSRPPSSSSTAASPAKKPPAPSKPAPAPSTPAKPAAAGKPATSPAAAADGALSEDTKRKLLDKLREYITACGGTLVSGWTVEVKQRKSGTTAGTNDAYYRGPTGKRYRSRREIAVELGLRPVDDKGGRGASASKVPPRKPAQELHADARALVEKEALALPLEVQGNISIVSLGTVRTQMGYFTRNHLWPVGYEARWVDPASGATFISSIASDGALGSGSTPVFRVSIQPSNGVDAPMLLASSKSADDVWDEVKLLGRAANTLDAAPPTHDASKPDPVEERRQRIRGDARLAEALRDVELPPVQWGMLLFGMADVRTLKLLEGLDNVPQCQGYYFAELRGGWKKIADSLAQELKAWEQNARKGGAVLPPPVPPSKPGLKRANNGASGQGAPKKPRVTPMFKGMVTKGLSKQDQKIQDDVAKVMDKMLTKVEKNIETEAKKEARRLEVSSQRSEQMKRMHEAKRELKAKQMAELGLQADVHGGAADKKARAHEKALVEDLKLPGAQTMPPRGTPVASKLPPHILSSLLQVWLLLQQHGPLLGVSRPPSLQTLERSIFSGAEHAATANGNNNSNNNNNNTATEPPTDAAEAVTIALLRLVVREVFDVSVQEYIEDSGDVSAQRKDMTGGCPVVDRNTWQHAAAALLAGVAMGQYLKQMHYKTNMFQPLAHWAGLQGALDPLLWLVFITGGFTNTPAMRAAIAFMPSSASQAASMSLLHRQSAAAVVAAETLAADADTFPELAAARDKRSSHASPLTDATALVHEVVASSSDRAAQQAAVEALLERLLAKITRMHRALVSSSGEDMSIAARSGRAIDLQSVALAAHNRVYACTGDAVNAAAEDVRSMCGAFRAAARRGVIPLEPAFEAHGEQIANIIEDALDEVMTRQPSAEGDEQGDTDKEGKDTEGKGHDSDEDADAEEPAGSKRPSSGHAALTALLEGGDESIDEQHLTETAEAQLERRAADGETSTAGRDMASIQELIQMERLAHLLAHPPSPDWRLPPEQHIALLYCLLMLALDSNTVRDALKDQHSRRDTLAQERAELKKAIKQAEKQAKEDAKNPAAAEKAAAAAGGTSRAMPTRSKVMADPLQKIDEDQKRVSELEQQLAELGLELSPYMGADRHRNDYWCMPSCVEPANKAAAALFSVVCQQYTLEAAPASGLADPAESMAFHDCREADRSAWPPRCDPASGRWVVYSTLKELDALIAWLHDDGVREKALKTRLRAVRDVMAHHESVNKAAVASAAAAAKPDSAIAKPEAEAPAAGGDADAATDASVPPETRAADVSWSETDAQRNARLIGEELLQTLDALPEDAMLSVRGGEAQRRAWKRFVTRVANLPTPVDCEAEALDSAAERPVTQGPAGPSFSPSPPDLMAALLLLEGMVAIPWLKPFWRLWSLPLPNPLQTHTFSAVWFRLKAFKHALREGRAATLRKELAAFARDGGMPAGSGGSRRLAERAAAAALAAESGATPGAGVGASRYEYGMSRRTRMRVVNYAEMDDDDDFGELMDPGSRKRRRNEPVSTRATRASARSGANVPADGGRAERYRAREEARKAAAVTSDEDFEGSDSDGDEDKDTQLARKLHEQLNARETRRSARGH